MTIVQEHNLFHWDYPFYQNWIILFFVNFLDIGNE